MNLLKKILGTGLLGLVAACSEPEKQAQYGLEFVSPQNGEVFNLDTTVPFTLLWQQQPGETISYLTLSTIQEESKTEMFPIPLTEITRENDPQGQVINMRGQYAGSQRRLNHEGKSEKIRFSKGNYETRAEMKTDRAVYTSHVQYSIR